MLQLLITSLIALLVKSPRTVMMWSLLVPLFMLMTIATTIGGRHIPPAAGMIFICPIVAVSLHMLKVKWRASRKAKQAKQPMVEGVRSKLEGNS